MADVLALSNPDWQSMDWGFGPGAGDGGAKAAGDGGQGRGPQRAHVSPAQGHLTAYTLTHARPRQTPMAAAHSRRNQRAHPRARPRRLSRPGAQ